MLEGQTLIPTSALIRPRQILLIPQLSSLHRVARGYHSRAASSQLQASVCPAGRCLDVTTPPESGSAEANPSFDDRSALSPGQR